MSLLRRVFNSFKKLFKVSVKRRKKPRKDPRKTKRNIKVKKSSPLRKIKRPSSRSKASQKSLKSAKPAPKKITSSSSSQRIKTINANRIQGSNKLGEVTHYFDKIKVCVIKINTGTIKKGDSLTIEGNKGSLTQVVSSMQIENEDVTSARKGQLVGLKVAKEVYVGDSVVKLLT